MSCRRGLGGLLLIAPLLAGCAANGPIEREVKGQAGRPVMLQPNGDGPETSDAEYRWDIVAAPDRSRATVSPAMSNAQLQPDLRGNYVVDRWVRYGVNEDLTYRFLVDVAGQRPDAKIVGPSSAPVGSQVMLDASESSSAEGRALSFAWRLTTRPRDSAATLTDLRAVTSSFTADTAGLFEVEILAFDGELWSEPPATLAIVVK